MPKIYIAGPMTGLHQSNLPAFAEAAKLLEDKGYEPINPGYRGEIPGYKHHQYMKDGLYLLLPCDGVAMLPGWGRSSGAKLEHKVAKAIGLRVRPLEVWLSEPMWNGEGY